MPRSSSASAAESPPMPPPITAIPLGALIETVIERSLEELPQTKMPYGRAALVWLLMWPGGRIRFCGYAVSSDREGHQVLTDQERAVIDRTDARSELVNAGAGDL